MYKPRRRCGDCVTFASIYKCRDRVIIVFVVFVLKIPRKVCESPRVRDFRRVYPLLLFSSIFIVVFYYYAGKIAGVKGVNGRANECVLWQGGASQQCCGGARRASLA